eukprot:CAMPEP_0204512654 /NCGR_PEP_ID=MMETSP0661-20131031/1071_1 /ASSEMBLY_ACC=CAM_ASM_000606 /TAXON_ID=109239 /ORGANISM="Alexandrium margalefi, Strain AMGDE01CS-322" /LENGTH=252 /DNA_ID=CAMNT_0051517779 /DNA_START=55 /DNA_END=813 /DNA_ORIENTATION=+
MEADLKWRNAQSTRASFAVGHVIALLMVLLPPLLYSIFLGFRIDVAYFVGRKDLSLLLLMPLGCLAPLVYLRGRQKLSSGIVMATLWVPMAVYACISLRHLLEASAAIEALEDMDCYAFEGKRHLQRAYEVAEELYTSCTERPGMELAPVRECPGYSALADAWEREFLYLQALEVRFPCAGICRHGRRLWEGAGRLAPACGRFAVQWLWSAKMQASMVLGYSVLALLASLPAMGLVVNPLVEQINAPLLMED